MKAVIMYFDQKAFLLTAILFLVACRQQPSDGIVESFAGPVPSGAALRLGKGEIADVAYSADGERLYVAGASGLTSYAVKDLSTSWQIAGANKASHVSPSPDGRWLTAGFVDGTLLLIDAADGDIVEQWDGYASEVGVSALAWQEQPGATGLLVVAGYDDGNALLLRVDGESVETIGGLPRQRTKITALRFNPDGRILATGNNSGEINLIDMADQILLFTFTDHASGKAIEDINWAPDGAHMVSGSKDGVVIEWDLEQMAAQQIWPPETGAILSTTYLVGGERLALATENGLLEQWRKGQTVEGIRSDMGEPLLAIAWNQAGDQYATASADGLLQLWSLPEEGGWPSEPTLTLVGNGPDATQVTAVAYSPDSKRLLSNLGTQAIIWEEGNAIPLVTYDGHEAQITAAAWSPDSEVVATADRAGSIQLWRANDGEHLQTLAHHTRPVTDLAWSPDGDLLASAGSLADELVLWDVQSGEIVRTLTGEGDGIWAAAFSTDGSQLAAGTTGGKIFIWNLAEFDDAPLELWRHQAWVSDLAWLNNQVLLSAGGDAIAVLWDLAARNSTALSGHSAPLRGVDFSPDGAQAVSVAIDGTTIIWDTNPRTADQVRQRLSGHTAGATAVSWSPDGKTVATGSEDGTVLIWDME